MASCFRFVLGSFTLGIWATILLPTAAIAGVNLKNGNFYISYTDIIVTVGEHDFSITRTYNSKSTDNLQFGFGWGSTIDTRLLINGDGSVSVQEIGSGKIYSYATSGQSREQLDTLLDRMMWGMERGGWLASDNQAREVRAELAKDSEQRRSVYRALVHADLIDLVEIGIGTRFRATSGEQSGVEIVREPGGFYRRSRDGFERFNLRGQLMETALDDQAYFRLIRDAEGHLRQIVLADDSRIDVTTNGKGKVTGLQYGDKFTEIDYGNRDRLTRSRDVAGNEFQYEYDDRFNMTAVQYVDGSRMELDYDPDTQFITGTRARNGSVTTYEYGNYPITEDGIIEHYFTLVQRFDSASSQLPSYERLNAYRIGVDQFGNKYTAGVLERENGVETETRYHPCGQPTLQRRDNRKNVYDYDAQCRMIQKQTNSEETRLTYDPRSGKISKVASIDLGSGKQSVTEFTYDLRGNLVSAVADTGRRADLTYDADDRIFEVQDETGLTLSFVYGALSKPTRIAIEGKGAIDVTYDSSGEIDSVESDQGHEMALQVTQAFQKLLALVKPAGVNFNL